MSTSQHLRRKYRIHAHTGRAGAVGGVTFNMNIHSSVF